MAPRFVARVVADSDAIADDGVRFLMSPRDRHALVAAHLDGNRALVDRLGLADPGPFLELPDPDAPWSPPAPITAREVAAVRRAALAACLRGRNPVAAARLAAQVAATARADDRRRRDGRAGRRSGRLKRPAPACMREACQWLSVVPE